MIKLLIYGHKKIFGLINKKGFIAEIHVADGKAIVEAKDQKVKSDIEQEIQYWLDSEGGGPPIPRHQLIKNEKGEVIRHIASEYPQKPIDPEFLQALYGRLPAAESKKIFGGYKILFNGSKIVNE